MNLRGRKQIIVLAAKIVFAAVVVLLLSRRVNARHVWDIVRGVHRGSIAIAILLGWATIAIGAWRWKRLLRIFGIAIPFSSLICIVQIGQFFAVFLPGPVGDDLTRMLYISRLAPGRVGEACTTVLLDRCLGLASVLALALFCIPWQWTVLSTDRQTYWLAGAILSAGFVVVLCAVFFFVAGHPTHRWFEKHLRDRAGRSVRDEAARIWGLLCDNKGVVVKLGCAAFLAQFVTCGFFYFAGASVGIKASYLVWITFVPIVLAANALPITIAGIGVREYLLVLFLGVIAGLDSAQALAASLVVFSIILTISLLGGLLYIFYKPKPHAPAEGEVAVPVP